MILKRFKAFDLRMYRSMRPHVLVADDIAIIMISRRLPITAIFEQEPSDNSETYLLFTVYLDLDFLKPIE